MIDGHRRGLITTFYGNQKPLTNSIAHLSAIISAALIAPSAFGAEPLPTPQSTGLPVTLSMAKPGYVTAVIERADGRRVSNLASGVEAQAGPLKFNWDFYDVGVQKGEKEPYTRTLVEPGTYRVRGLVHDGLDLRYEFSELLTP